MNKDKTEIIIVLDRSGSMSGIRTDMEGGLNTFLDEQKKQPGQCLVSLYKFDDKYEPVFEAKNISDVGNIALEPRGYTALHDAVGKTINSVGERLKNTPEADRPLLVIFVVITDGAENASREYKDKIKEMVEHQQNKYAWKFVFLGANQDAVTAGASMGFVATNSMSYAPSAAGVSNTYGSLSNNVSLMRTASATKGVAANFQFSESDRIAAMSDTKTTSVGSTTTPVAPTK